MSQSCVRSLHVLVPHKVACRYPSVLSGAMAVGKSMDPFLYYAPPYQQPGGREKGAVKRDIDFTFFTARARGAVTELQ